MKANEFVKEHGWGKVKSIVINFNYNSSNKFIVNLNNNSAISIYDLKRLVESHELVVQCGGLEDARSHLESIRFNIATKTWFGQALLNWSMYADKLEKAILDVESCQ